MTRWSATAIAEEMARRRSSMTPLLKRMIEVRDRVNGDVIVPVPDVDDDIPLSSLAPLLIADAVEFPALYATQARPTISVPAIRASSTRSVDYADVRRKAIGHTWDDSWMELVLGRMYRHLAGYATSALVVDLDFNARMPRITTRDPLTAYPEPKAAEDLTLPSNCGFVFGKSLDWLHANFPETRERYPKGAGFARASAGDTGELWDLVEWIDNDQIFLGVLGPRTEYQSWSTEPTRWAMELRADANPLGRCTAVAPRRVTLDRIQAQLANLIGHSDLIAKLTYLDLRATEKSIFPDRFVLAKTGQNPRLVAGKWLGGETGETNLVVDAEQIGELRGTPDPNTKITLDRIERNLRISSGLIPQSGGETYGALRTGRGIDSLMGAALDPRTAELHKIGERYLSAVNELVLEAYRSRWPGRTYSVSFPGEPGEVEFIPSKHVEDLPGVFDRFGRPARSVKNRVHYPIPGMDDQNATLVIGQMLGAGLISKRQAMRMHPHVIDPEGNEREQLVEQLESLAALALSQRAQQGGLPMNDLTRLIELAVEGKRIAEAMRIADEEASERQAAAAPPPGEGQVAAPESMPGLSMPGEGAEMGEPAIAPPPDDLENMRALVSALQSPQAVA